MTPATAFSDLLQIHLVVPFGSLTTHPFCTPLFSPTTSLISPPSPSSSEETVSLGATNPPFNPPFPPPPPNPTTSNHPSPLPKDSLQTPSAPPNSSAST